MLLHITKLFIMRTISINVAGSNTSNFSVMLRIVSMGKQKNKWCSLKTVSTSHYSLHNIINKPLTMSHVFCLFVIWWDWTILMHQRVCCTKPCRTLSFETAKGRHSKEYLEGEWMNHLQLRKKIKRPLQFFLISESLHV